MPPRNPSMKRDSMPEPFSARMAPSIPPPPLPQRPNSSDGPGSRVPSSSAPIPDENVTPAPRPPPQILPLEISVKDQVDIEKTEEKGQKNHVNILNY